MLLIIVILLYITDPTLVMISTLVIGSNDGIGVIAQKLYETYEGGRMHAKRSRLEIVLTRQAESSFLPGSARLHRDINIASNSIYDLPMRMKSSRKAVFRVLLRAIHRFHEMRAMVKIDHAHCDHHGEPGRPLPARPLVRPFVAQAATSGHKRPQVATSGHK